MSDPLLSVQDLHVNFKVQKQLLHAVQGVSFDLNRGEILGIVGESGCGKSAAAKGIGRLLPPHTTQVTGKALYKGKNLLSLHESQMQKIRGKEIGMVFQDSLSSLNPTMKIGDQIAEGYLHHQKGATLKEGHEYAIQLLELVGIPQPEHRVNEYPHTLSGGMRQRVMIALALAPRPELIIADEPTTALDVTIQAQILDLLLEIRDKTKTSFILISHDLSVVAGYCDNVLVMYAGKVVEKASVDALFENPSHPYTQGLLQSIPRLDRSRDLPLVPIEGSPPNLIDTIKGCPFQDRCHYAQKKCREENPAHTRLATDHSMACWKGEFDD